jgi:DNA-binding response OmpR family regulator
MNNLAKRILIVDDEAKIIEVVKAFLEIKGFNVFTAESGEQAFKILNSENISLVILDLMLPDMSGEEICKIIRKKSRIPIIMLTAKVGEDYMLGGFGIGADDYITKPFSLKALSARIEAVLRRSSDDLVPLYNKSSFNNGDLEIDFVGHTVKKNSLEVRLTPNEFKILTSLIKYPNKVFTRDELISVALCDKFEGFDRAIDSHIKNLRQKIESDPKNPVYVLTIHGVGYKFGGE